MRTARAQANFYKTTDDADAPGAPMQHPLIYPHGTLFMAPGPAGQTAAVPADPDLRELMVNEVRICAGASGPDRRRAR